MRVGFVYRWNTTSVTGYENRDKYHVCVSDNADGGEFLYFFINKVSYSPDDMEVDDGHCPFLELIPSYLSVMPIRYDEREIERFNDNPIHELSAGFLADLSHLVERSKVVERFDKGRICNALARRIANLA